MDRWMEGRKDGQMDQPLIYICVSSVVGIINGGRNLKCSEENLCQYHSVHHKSDGWTSPGLNPGLCCVRNH
jgi:hypothetical protein